MHLVQVQDNRHLGSERGGFADLTVSRESCLESTPGSQIHLELRSLVNAKPTRTQRFALAPARAGRGEPSSDAACHIGASDSFCIALPRRHRQRVIDLLPSFRDL